MSGRSVGALHADRMATGLLTGNCGPICRTLCTTVPATSERRASAGALAQPVRTCQLGQSGLCDGVFAYSDNVLRGGLTVKHVDVPELLRVALFAPQEAAVLKPAADANGERHYLTPAAEFALSSVALDRLPRDTELFSATVDGPEVLLFLDGQAVVTDAQGRSLACRSGEAMFVSAAVAGYRARGTGLLFRARVPEPEG